MDERGETIYLASTSIIVSKIILNDLVINLALFTVTSTILQSCAMRIQIQ